MKRIWKSIATTLVLTGCVISSAAGTVQQPDAADAADAARLIEVFGLRRGSSVADVGAATGKLTWPLALHVGETGRVYATDINAQRLVDLRDGAKARSLGNVVVIEGAEKQTNLPDACCDAVFMRHVYHHFHDPPAMNASLMRALKPGGKMMVIDFQPDSRRSAPPGKRNEGADHGVMTATVIEELQAAGFHHVRAVPWPSKTYVAVLAERP